MKFLLSLLNLKYYSKIWINRLYYIYYKLYWLNLHLDLLFFSYFVGNVLILIAPKMKNDTFSSFEIKLKSVLVFAKWKLKCKKWNRNLIIEISLKYSKIREIKCYNALDKVHVLHIKAVIFTRFILWVIKLFGARDTCIIYI